MAQLGLLLCILLDDIVYPWLVALNHWTRCWSRHGSPLCLREWNNWANTQANQLEWPLVTKWLQQFLGSSVVLVWHLIEIFRTICLCTRSSGNLFQHHNHFQEQWSPTDQLRIFKYRVFQKNSFFFRGLTMAMAMCPRSVLIGLKMGQKFSESEPFLRRSHIPFREFRGKTQG